MKPRWSNLKLFLPIILGFFLVLTSFGFVKAQQTNVHEAEEISPASIERLLQDLEDPERREELKQDLKALLASQETGEPASPQELDETKPSGLLGNLLTLLSELMQEINQILSNAGKNLLQIPEMFMDLAKQAQDPEVLKTWGEMAGKVLLVLAAGFAAERVVRRLLQKARKSLEDKETYNMGIRALFLLGTTLLELIPVAAFAVAAYVLLPLLEPRTGTQLVALTLINAIILVRIILALTKLVLVPGAPSLRLVPLESECVHYLYIWVRRLVVLGVYGYFILEAALLLGLPSSLYISFLKLLGLIISVMAIILVLQNRSSVASCLSGPQEPPEEEPPSDTSRQKNGPLQAFLVLRRYLAHFWHIGAILIILGLFGTWALEIEGGLFFLARSLILTFIIVALASFLIRLILRGIDRLFQISTELQEKYPGLEARANRYLPILQYVLKGLISLIAIFSILQIWGLGILTWIFSPQGLSLMSNLLLLALIIGGSFLAWELISNKIEKTLARERKEEEEGGKPSTRLLTLLPLLKNVSLIVLVLVAGMSVLSQLGVNIAPLLAGVGVLGLAVGFGAQTLVRDVITGAFILIEDSIAVGDWVEAGGHAGTVEHLTVRTVTLRDLHGTVHVIPFGDVTTVLNYNRNYGYALVDAQVAYKENYGEVVQALQDVAEELQQDETWGPDIIGELEIFGLNRLGEYEVDIRVRMKTLPMRQFAVRRAFLERMKRVFDERGIEIPFPHRTLWFGEDKTGDAPPMRVIQETRKKLPPTSEEPAPKPPEETPQIQYYTESDASQEVVREREEAQADETEEEQEQKKQDQERKE